MYIITMSDMILVQYTPGYGDITNYGEGCTNPNEVYEVEYCGKRTCMMKVAEEAYTMIDFQYINKIRQYKWSLHKQTGYICHSVNQTSAKEVGNINRIYLHQYVLKYCTGESCPDDCSIDHFNRVKVDNRVVNLRYATQSLQNENRVRVFSNRQEPPDELKDIGITEYPKHVRYDTTQARFLIEKHPMLPPSKNYVSGTRSGGIINRYYDTMMTGQKLEEGQVKEASERSFMNAWYEYYYIATQFNMFMHQRDNSNAEHVFNVQFPIIAQTFTNHIMLIDHHVTETKDESILIKDKNTLFSDAEFTLTRDMMPKYVGFSKEKTNKKGDRCGSKFTHEVRDKETGKRVCTALSSSSYSVSTKEKYESMLVAPGKMSAGP